MLSMIILNQPSIYILIWYRLHPKGFMSNYFPLAFNQLTIQRRPLDLQPNVPNAQKMQNQRYLSIHSLSLRTQNSFVMKKSTIKKNKSTASKEPIYSVHSQFKHTIKKSSVKSNGNADLRSQLEKFLKNQQRFYRTIQEKTQKNDLKDMKIQQRKDLENDNSTKILLNKTQKLLSILVVKPVKYSQKNIIQHRDDSLYYFNQQDDEQKEFSAYCEKKRAVSEKQLRKKHSYSIAQHIPSENSQKARELKQRWTYRPKIKLLSNRQNKIDQQGNVFLSVKQINLEKRTRMRMQMSAKQRYINYNVTALQLQQKRPQSKLPTKQQRRQQSRQQSGQQVRQQYRQNKRNDRPNLNRINTHQLGISPWQIIQK